MLWNKDRGNNGVTWTVVLSLPDNRLAVNATSNRPDLAGQRRLSTTGGQLRSHAVDARQITAQAHRPASHSSAADRTAWKAMSL